MTKRRSRGDGGLHWDETRQRWIATVTIGYRPNGKRIVRSRSGRTKTEAKNKLDEIRRDVTDGLPITPQDYTVSQAVRDWLKHGLNGRDEETVSKLTTLAEKHVIPALGARKLHKLTADEVDDWLLDKATTLATRTLQDLRSILRRSVNRAQARDKVKRNVVLLCEELPTGRPGRKSKALTFEQAEAVLIAAEGTPWRAYIVLSLLTGARTEELRPLTWSHVDMIGDPKATPPIPPNIRVWTSVRFGGETKTPKSRRSLALPERCLEALRIQRARQAVAKLMAGARWKENDLVFASQVGTELDAHNVRRGFRMVLKADAVKATGLKPEEWTPRELRHSFVSLLSDNGMPIEQISRLVGHAGTAVTELVYRLQIRPVIDHGATAMDRIFPATYLGWDTPNLPERRVELPDLGP